MTGEIADHHSVVEQRERFREWLRREAGNQPVRLVETHVSMLGLTSERVWKLKKAVRLPFVDLSTPELRRQNAEREVTLNRRFAPDVYLGVVPLVGAGGEVVDSMVEMRRMPDDRRLATVLATAHARDCVDRVADALVRIHASSPTGGVIDTAGSRAWIAELWERNVEEMHAFTESVLDAADLTAAAGAARRYLDGREPLFERRIAEGRIRDGHGDLLADDVFCLDDGPRLLDCLEFDDELRYGDVLADVAFLAMDLEDLGYRALSDRLLARYRQASGDAWPTSLADHYVAYRALVRSKVACLRARDDAPGAPAAAHARRLLALARRRLEHGQVRLLLIGGPPATGKTTLARELGRRTGWAVLHSDELRKRLAGLDPATSAASDLDSGLYTAAWDRRTYDALLDTARVRLAEGECVIADASWADEETRAAAIRVADETSSVGVSVVLDVPGAVADERARARAAAHADAADASDASDALSAVLRSRFVPWPDAIELDATVPRDALAARVLAAVGAVA